MEPVEVARGGVAIDEAVAVRDGAVRGTLYYAYENCC